MARRPPRSAPAHWCGYVLGAHPVDAEKLHSFLYRTLKPSSRGLDRLDSLFVGFDHGAGTRSARPCTCRRAVRRSRSTCLKVGAAIGPRPIAVNGFGRQEQRYSNLLSDRMNRPGSPHFYYHTNAVNISGAADWRRYREPVLAGLAHVPDRGRLRPALLQPIGATRRRSHVGPRWMEKLGRRGRRRRQGPADPRGRGADGLAGCDDRTRRRPGNGR